MQVCLQELLSNASEALDKVHRESIKEPREIEFIKIYADKTNAMLTIADHGTGITKKELEEKLGTITKPSTKLLIETIVAGGDVYKIGQIGIGSLGFYSTYLVSDKVRVRSKSNDDVDEQYMWESGTGGSFTVEKIHGKIERGTEVTCYLKEDQIICLEERRIKDLVEVNSQHIGFPVELYVKRSAESDNENEKYEEVALGQWNDDYSYDSEACDEGDHERNVQQNCENCSEASQDSGSERD